ncbi:hypothetical protein NDU88_007754 [Pleurodeles waltl]|uniref:t-SNARE coiled-coil homology domain-containing protein n=1 Tax=Pleurodeles waltl TaxID=8319 RepID=A0AAV7QLP5_PLEWA|nr:hypothetical protein NDU88_007754 [Pleurodeles waltl]
MAARRATVQCCAEWLRCPRAEVHDIAMAWRVLAGIACPPRPIQWASRTKPRPSCSSAGVRQVVPPVMMRDLARWGESEVPAGEEQDLRQILVAMQHSSTQINGKINSLSYRMDRMTERLDKHAERLDQSERRMSEVEDGQIELTTGQTKLSKSVSYV